VHNKPTVSSGISSRVAIHLMQFAHSEQCGSPGVTRLAATDRCCGPGTDRSAEGIDDQGWIPPWGRAGATHRRTIKDNSG
jgi:hypothetical protein